MAVSGTRTFAPQFAELLAEAFARIQIRGAAITQDHIDEAIRSANLMFVAGVNGGTQQFNLVQSSLTLTAGTATYNLPTGALDIWSAIYRKDDQDTPVWPFSRTDYHRIPDKTNQGRPFNYFVDKGKVGGTLRTVSLWPTPDTTNDELNCWFLMRTQDATSLIEDLSVAYEWFDVYAAELTARLAEKFAPALVGEKRTLAESAYALATTGERERAPVRLRMRGYHRGR